MTKFHFYILCSLICWVGVYNCPVQATFYFLFGTLFFWVLALWWAWENKENTIK
jgi:hypothetical protein